jgi:hypothetical protein
MKNPGMNPGFFIYCDASEKEITSGNTYTSLSLISSNQK